jgi:hypothetical protein
VANVVGDAYVVVRAITAGVERDIRGAFDGLDRVGSRAGEDVGNSFRKGFGKNTDRGLFSAAFQRSALQARERLSSLIRVGYVLGPAITALGGAIGVLITGFTSLVSVLGGALIPTLAVAAQSFSAVAQAAITLKLAFAGVGKAIQAGNKAQKSGASNAKALEKALKALERARRTLAETEEDANKRESESKKRLTEAEEELSKARQQAIEDLQQLGFDSEDAAIAEQKAALELEKAREELARVSDLPPNSRARKEAELAFAQADLNYRRAIDRNSDLKKEEAKNAELAKKGPEALIDGQTGVIEALKGVEDAEKDLAETKLQNARAILSATEARDDAKEAVKDIEDGAGAADAYADALSDLSPEAQRFVKYIVSLKDEFKKITAAAGKELFPKLEEAIQNLVDNLFPRLIPLLESTGGVLGNIAKEFSETITKGENLDRLERIWKSNEVVLTNFGDAASNLYEVLLILLDAARPLTEEFSKFVAAKTAAWRESLKVQEQTGKLSEKFEIARGILKDLGTIIGNTFRGFGNIISANVGPGSGGQIFLDYLKDVTKKFEELKTIDNKPLKEFFADAAVNGTKFLSLLGNIVGGFITLADNPELGVFFDQLNVVTDIFQRIGENLSNSLPAFGEFLIQFALITETLTESGSIETFFDVLAGVLRNINAFLNTEFGQTLLKTAAAILPVLTALGLVLKVGGFFGRAVVGSFLAIQNAAGALSFAIARLKQNFAMLTYTLGLGAGPTLAIIAAVAALVAIVVLAYQKSEIFREALKTLVEGVFVALKRAFDEILAVIQEVVPSIGSFGDIFKKIGDFLGTYIVPLLEVVLVGAIDLVAGAIKLIIRVAGGLIEAFKVPFNVIKGIFALFRGDTKGAADAFKNAFEAAVNAIKRIFGGLAGFFKDIINAAIIRPWNRLVGGLSFTLPKILGGGTISLPKLTELAEGGVVYPRTGGTAAILAEAGRPERIEPLDAQGLSARDRAIINELSGPGKGTTVNVTVNPSEGMDERELAAIVSRQIAFQLRRGAA